MTRCGDPSPYPVSGTPVEENVFVASLAKDLPAPLQDAMRRQLAATPASQLTKAVERLMDGYRQESAIGAEEPLLLSQDDAAAYLAYRMPATYAAVRSALAEFALRAPRWTPHSHLDIGGGTGAAAWAMADAWPALGSTTIIDWSDAALRLGRELVGAASSPAPALRSAQWRKCPIGPGLELPDADVVTLSYVLGELTETARAEVLTEAAARAQVVVVVEPGTPAGFARVRVGRDRLLEAGFTLVAPCPHGGGCPVEPDRDWCHFSVRVARSALHRQVKGGSLSYEDEKFSYVVAAREPVDSVAGRIVRHPLLRKGMVRLELCTAEGQLAQSILTKKRHGALYKAARDVTWGSAWPPRGAARSSTVNA